MKILSIDLGSYKAVVASSDTSAGEIILSKAGGRSTKMAVDYRGKVRTFGNVNVTCKEREKVAENIRKEIEELAEEIKNKSKCLGKVSLPAQSHVYGLLNSLITHYATSKNVPLSDIEVEIVVPETYTQLHKAILAKIVWMICPKIAVECISDSMALSAYYLSRRSTEEKVFVVFVDVGDQKTTVTSACIHSGGIQINQRRTVPVGGMQITEMIFRKIYKEIDPKIPDLFDEREFRVRNLKKIEWIKGAIVGLPSVSTQVDVSYDRSVGVTITRSDLQQLEAVFEPVQTELQAVFQSMLETKALLEKEEGAENPMRIEVELVGGSSKIPLVEAMVHAATGCKPEVHLNADESVALGGVYRRLMESPFHRFRYDPLIKDILSEKYYILVEDAKTRARVMNLFDTGCRFLKETKSRIQGKKYDKSIVLEQPPRKNVKISKITETTEITMYCGDYPVYRLLRKAPAEPSAENTDDTQKAPAEKKTVSLVVSLNATGGVDISSEDLEVVDVLGEVNMEKLRLAENAQIRKENAAIEIEGTLNTLQAGIFRAIELLSDELGSLPIVEEGVVDALWEYSQMVEDLAGSARTMQEVNDFKEKAAKQFDPTLSHDWDAYAEKLTAEASKAHSVEIVQPAYPGVFGLFCVKTQVEKLAQQELDRKEKIRKYQEQEKLQREQEMKEKEERAMKEQQEAEKPEATETSE
ncbi:uncharacterized protein NEMAJ01_1131 [Nematocida major]|uniref:uncharacterized protein n=1 Tax=Nematocida major TaxID=1912982 RepID=UPI00200795A7|nr:uncharacterized protein NEMAJ01_1131 [Nematocida major]KAH9386235.1 hypothetical protein NEMAJ01_1131 [Nematocida major]